MAMIRTAYTFYFLHDPEDEKIGYVGMTTETIQSRVRRHVSEAMLGTHSPNSRKNVWLRELLDRGVRPYAKVLEMSAFPDAVQAGSREGYWIAQMQDKGINLLNMTTGSPGTPGLVVPMTDEVKEIISEKMRIYGEDVYQEVLAMRKEGIKIKDICEKTGISRSTYFKEMKHRIDQDLKSEE
jgi:hypothetical protein